MKYIREYQVFEASVAAPQALTAVQIEWLDKCAGSRWVLNPQTGLINVVGNFNCSKQGLTDLKGVRFGKVSGDFSCYGNLLTSLVGSPQTVSTYFDCAVNHLTTLLGAPKTVINFSCSNNHLTTLAGAPQVVNGRFYCRSNYLISLEGAPKTVHGEDFHCENNPVSESALKAIFNLMKKGIKGMSYQQALEEHWPEMGDEDRVLMYKQMPDLSPEDERKYKALATYNNIKGYL